MDRKKIREIKRISKKGDTDNIEFELDHKYYDCRTKDNSKLSMNSEIHLPNRILPELNFQIESSSISNNDNAIEESNFNFETGIINKQDRINENEKIKSKQTNQKYSLPKRKMKKKFFEEFLVIGIENKGLEYIFDMEEMMLTPKILYNYPKELNEYELEFNIKSIANFCFNDGVKVRRYEINNNKDYEQLMFDSNFFSRPKRTFCLLQQVSPEDIQKYLVFGIIFEDFIITPIKDKNKSTTGNIVNIFIYEKTYLFISNEPLCNLFEGICQTLLSAKKLNFLKNLEDFSCIFTKNKFDIFLRENNEKTSLQIKEVIDYFFKYQIHLTEDNISFKSRLNSVILNYYYPKEEDRKFIAMDWLSKRFLKLFNLDQYYEIMIRILAEQSFIFISEDIQDLTLTVLGFSFLILPFQWPFILIPNLPLEMMEVLESPVPIIIGIIGGDEMVSKIKANTGIYSNIVHITQKDKDKIEITYREKLSFELPSLGNLKNSLFKEYNLLTYYHGKKYLKKEKKMHEAYEGSCSNIFKSTYNNLKSEVSEKILGSLKIHENNLKNKNNLTENEYNTRLNKFKKDFCLSLNFGDKQFGKVFTFTQMFLNFLDKYNH